MVFDNVPSRAVVRRFLPSAGAGHVIVTTRDGMWPGGQVLPVGPLNAAAGVELLIPGAATAGSGWSSLVDVARRVAVELGGLPLALAQAAAYVECHPDTGLAGYLRLLGEARLELLSVMTPAGYPSPVSGTWSVAMAALAAESPGSVTLLRLLACYAPDEIPYRLLLTSGRGPGWVRPGGRRRGGPVDGGAAGAGRGDGGAAPV